MPAYHAELGEAIAAFRVKSTVEIAVDSSDDYNCKGLEPFVDELGSLMQWALTVDKRMVVSDYEEEEPGEGNQMSGAIFEEDIGDDDYYYDYDDYDEEEEEEEEKEKEEDEEAEEDHGNSEVAHDMNENTNDEGVEPDVKDVDANIEQDPSREEEPESGIANNDERKGNSDSHGNDAQQDRPNHKRHFWIFTLKPATPSTQAQIPVSPKA